MCTRRNINRARNVTLRKYNEFRKRGRDIMEVILLAVAVFATSLYAGCLDVRTKKLEEDIDNLIEIAKLQQKLLDNVSERADMNREKINQMIKLKWNSVYGKAVQDGK